MRPFLEDRSGVGAIEFAAVCPVLVLLLLGGIEVGNQIDASRKLVRVTRAAADLTSQYAQVSTASVSTILNAAALSLTPLSTTPLGIVVSEVSTNAQGVSTVTWSQALNATPMVVGAVVQIPSGIAPAGTSIILSRSTYAYTPTFGAAFIGTRTLNGTAYMSPRLSATVNLTS